eukprot:708052_1
MVKRSRFVIDLSQSDDQRDDSSFGEDFFDEPRPLKRSNSSQSHSRTARFSSLYSRALPDEKKHKKSKRKNDWRTELAFSQSLFNPSQSSEPSSVEDAMWVDKYEPATESELCVHRSKVQHVKDWLQNSSTLLRLNRPCSKMLILIGPSGCGKTSIVRSLASDLGFRILTWSDEANQWFPRQAGDTFTQDSISIPYRSQLARFQAFLNSTQRKTSLFSGKQNLVDLVVLEDLPYAGKPEYRRKLQGIIRNFLNNSRRLAILMLTDDDGSNLVKVLDSDILNDSRVSQISCNPISVSGIIKALNRIIENEEVDFPAEKFAAIANNCKGDLRNAIHTLQFECEPRPTPPTNTKKRKRSRKSGKVSFKKVKELAGVGTDKVLGPLSARDDTFSLFHSLGKILYAKRTESSEHIIDRSCMSPDDFIEFLHHNHLSFPPCRPTSSTRNHSVSSTQSQHVSSITNRCVSSTTNYTLEEEEECGEESFECDTLSDISQSFSDADLLSCAASRRFGNALSAIPHDMACSVASRGYLAGHPDPVSGKWTPLYRPFRKESNHIRTRLLVDSRRLFASTNVSLPKSSFCSTFPFLSLISRSCPRRFSEDQLNFLSSLTNFSPNYASSFILTRARQFDKSELLNNSTQTSSNNFSLSHPIPT